MFTAFRNAQTFLIAAGLSLGTAACVSAQGGYGAHRDNGSYRNNGYYDDVGRVAYDNGYREGIDHGQNDARRGRDYAYAHSGEYRDADDGYRRGYGSIESYRRVFRQGYAEGYDAGYRGSRVGSNFPRSNYPAYPNNGPVFNPGSGRVYGNVATENGYRDGFEAGRNDGRDRDNYDPRGAKRYREGDHDYDSRYGSRDQYKQEYRAAFQQGYEQGFRENRR